MRNYLRTFKPTDTESTMRLSSSVVFLICLWLIIGISFGYTGMSNLNSSLLSLVMSTAIFLSMDNTVGFGRKYEATKKEYVISLLILVGVISIWIYVFKSYI